MIIVVYNEQTNYLILYKISTMNRLTVTSSMLKSVGYQPETQTLETEFNNGDVYQYYQVTSDMYAAMTKAKSYGKYMLANIINHVPHRLLLTSSMLNGVAYNWKKQILETQFNKGGVYQYFDVPKEFYKGLKKASSHGKYMWTNDFKQFPYAKVN